MPLTSRELAEQLLDSMHVAHEARSEFRSDPNGRTADRCERTITDLADCLCNIKQWMSEP